MAKRSRGAARPGQMRPATRRPPRPAGRSGIAATSDAPRSGVGPLVDEDTQADADLDQTVAERAPARRRDRAEAPASTAPVRTRSGQASGLLAQRAAAEYSYVAKDVRHIGVVGGGLFGLLIALYVVLEVLHVVNV